LIKPQPRKISSKKGVFPGFPAVDVYIRAFFGKNSRNFDRKCWENEGRCRVEAGCRSTFEIWDFREIPEFSYRKIPGFFRFPVCSRTYAAIFQGVFQGNSPENFPPEFPENPGISGKSGKIGKNAPPKISLKNTKIIIFFRAKIVDFHGFFAFFF